VAADESHEQRVNRELIELLNELRVALPGVQVLFAFLLTVPFTSGFRRVTDAQKYAYMVTLVSATLASILLIAPSSYHRLRFREQDKEAMLQTSNRLAIVGLAAVAVGMTSAVYLVTDYLFQSAVSVTVTSCVGISFLVLWYAIPLSRKGRHEG
jgi:hypothetical protein